MAILQLNDGRAEGAETSRKIQRYLCDKVSLHKIPRRITYVATLPRGENGKLYKGSLKRAFPSDEERGIREITSD